MAASEDESFEVAGAEPKTADAPWQPGKALLPHAPSPERADWVSLVLSLLGRRAPARRPALAAEA